MEVKKYYNELDVIKGLAILLVILGHSFAQKPINIYELLPNLGAFVREFQMPLFFIASGFLWKPITTWNALENKAKRLAVPYFAFGLVGIVIKSVMGGGIFGPC